MRLRSAWDRVRHVREKVSAVCARREVLCAPFCGGGLLPIVRCGAIAGVSALFLASGAKMFGIYWDEYGGARPSVSLIYKYVLL